MTPTAALIIIPGVAYLLAAILYGWQGKWPQCITFAGYAFSNIGLLWLDRLMAK
jgi:hypothetical protein